MPRPLLLALGVLAACQADPPATPTITLSPDAPATTADLTVAIVGRSAELDYAVAWARDGAAVSGYDLTVPAADTHRGERWGVSVVATDAKGLASEPATAEVTIQNTRPTVSVAIPESAVTTTADIVAVATGADLDDDTLEIQWSWKRNGVPTAHTGDTIPASDTESGDVWDVTAVAFDGAATSNPATARATVGNTSPVIRGVTIGPEDPRVTDTITATVDVEDADGDSLATTYQWRVDGGVEQSGPSNQLLSTKFRKGSHITVVAKVSDGDVTVTSDASNELVVANTPPTYTKATITPSRLTEASTATCTAEGYADVDHDAQDKARSTIEWVVDGVSAGTGATLDGAAFDRDQSVVCRATPHDGDDAGAPVASAAITVSNTPPAIASVALSPTAPFSDDTITATVTGAADVDGDAISYAYRWTLDGSFAGSSASFAGGTAKKGQTVQVEVTPSDGTDTGAAVKSPAVTIANKAPTISVTLADPLFGDTDAKATAVVDDADGDVLTTTYKWYVNGKYWLAVRGDTLPADYFQPADLVYVVAEVTDGTDTASATSATVKVSNNPPTIDSAAYDDAVYYTNDVITVAVTASDLDGHDVTTECDWTVDGTTVVAGDLKCKLDGRTWFDKDQVVQATVRASDGYEDVETTLSTLSILNSAPTSPGIQIDPTEPFEGVDDLLCVIGTEAYDADGDTIDYTVDWTVDGLPWTGAVTTDLEGDTILASDTVKDQEWVCSVVASDGFEDSAAAEASAVVVNQYTIPITASNLLYLPNSCGSSRYGSGSNWGFTWTDKSTGSMTPTKVTVEIYAGLNCSSGRYWRYARLNGTLQGSWTLYNTYDCSCTPSSGLRESSYTLDLADYVVGGKNTLLFDWYTTEGVNSNSKWDGAYARVIVEY